MGGALVLGMLWGAEALAAPGGAATPAAAPVAATVAPLAPVEARTAEGLVVRANLRDRYVEGFPALVELSVHNPTDAPKTFPDLARRPWLVRFRFELGGKRSERATTPPAADPGGDWTIAPRGERRVLLEIPTSAGLAGFGTLAVSVGDPARPTELPVRAVAFAPAQPVGGMPLAEPTIRSTSGADIPWLQKTPSGWDLYLLHMSAKRPRAPQSLTHLARLPKAHEVALSRARPQDAAARWLYWPESGGRFGIAKLDGLGLEGAPRAVAIPYAEARPLARGVTDGEGGLVVPLWVPAPAGASGRVQVLCVDRRGVAILRKVADLPAAPAVVETGVDGAGQPLLLLGHDKALDLYRVDPKLPAEVPARGTRLRALEAGERLRAAGFDTLPDSPDRAGGLVALALVAKEAEGGPRARLRAYDLQGGALPETAEVPWKVPGEVQGWLTRGRGPWTTLSRDAKGAWWATTLDAAPLPASGPGFLWQDGEALLVRKLGGPQVIVDAPAGARAPPKAPRKR
jgi:hypothetical protein